MSAEQEISTDSSSLLLPIQRCLESFSKAVEAGDSRQSEEFISELDEYLDSNFHPAFSDPNDEEMQRNCVLAINHICSFLKNPSLDQAIVDALSFELPKVVAKLAGTSQRCSDVVDSIINHFIIKCSPRDMISVFSEALDLYGKTTDSPGYVSAILRGFSIALLSLKRRQVEQIKVALPILLKSVKAAVIDVDDRDIDSENLFEGAICIADSILEICKKLEVGTNGQLCGLLRLYVLEMMTAVSIITRDNVSSHLSVVKRLSSFFTYCGLSYADLLTDYGADPLINLKCDETDDLMDCFGYVKHGAVLSVIWGHISDEVAQAAGQDESILKDELRSTQSRRWLAFGMMKYIFSLSNLPCVLKKHAADFLLVITENCDQQDMDEDMICSIFTPHVMSTLQAIISVITDAPDAELRKTAFAALKRILADNPSSLRLDMMHVLIKTSTSSSMVALLLDCIRENLREDYIKLREERVLSSSSTFWSDSILDLVEFVLLPPDGGPPSLPEQCDKVNSALNLYRYVLITEKTGKTNYTGVLSKDNLEKAYNKWFLPLKALLIHKEDTIAFQGPAIDMFCGLNPVNFVLFRCIELVKENIKQS
ncbi:unnamed protein product [Amaranthus hypochondriacus]